MDDFENGFEEEGFDSFEDFIDGLDDEEEVLDPATVVQVRSTGGGHFIIPAEGPMTIADVMREGNLTVGQGVEYWVNGVVVEPSFEVGPGTIITIVGLVKGG